MPQTDLIAILKTSKVFKGLSDNHLKDISARGKVVSFESNQTIIREGQTEHPLFIVIRGRVEVVLPKETDGQGVMRATRIKLNRLAQGDCLGEYSLIDKQPASASVIAVEPCTLFEMSKSDFEEIIDADDFLGKTVFKNILLITIKRARDSNRELDICFN